MSFYKRNEGLALLKVEIFLSAGSGATKSRPLLYSFFALILGVVFCSNPSDARAICVEASSDGRPTHSTKRTILFIENDFALELRQSTPPPPVGVDDALLTELQVQSALMQAAEIWNLQTRATAMVYGGRIGDKCRK